MKTLTLAALLLMTPLAAGALSPLEPRVTGVPMYTEAQLRGMIQVLEEFRAKGISLIQDEEKFAKHLVRLQGYAGEAHDLASYFKNRAAYVRAKPIPELNKTLRDFDRRLKCLRSARPVGPNVPRREGPQEPLSFAIPDSCYNPGMAQRDYFRSAIALWSKQAVDESLLEAFPDSFTIEVGSDGRVVRCSRAAPPCRQHFAWLFEDVTQRWQKLKDALEGPHSENQD